MRHVYVDDFCTMEDAFQYIKGFGKLRNVFCKEISFIDNNGIREVFTENDDFGMIDDVYNPGDRVVCVGSMDADDTARIVLVTLPMDDGASICMNVDDKYAWNIQAVIDELDDIYYSTEE